MEYRCRLGTPGGEIIEGVYVAESEARLRREFEEKGLYVLGIQRAGRARARLAPRCRAHRISTREFLVFNQELATLLKAGMPLVQSLDILRRGSPIRSSRRCWTTCTSACGRAARCPKRSRRRALFPGVYTASLLAGEKSGSLEQVIRRYVAYVKVVSSGQAQDDLGAGVSRDPARRSRSSSSAIIVLRVVPEFGGVLRAVRPGAAAVDPHHRRRVEVRARLFLLDRRGIVGWRRAFWSGCSGRASASVSIAGSSAARYSVRSRRKFSTSQAARTLATLLGGGIPLVNAIDVAARSIEQPLHRARAARRRRSRFVRGGRWRRR